jgi:hypothetical protein
MVKDMAGRKLTDEDTKWLEGYRAEVVRAFSKVFAGAADRFPDGDRLLRRFNEGLDSVRKAHRFGPGTKRTMSCVLHAPFS